MASNQQNRIQGYLEKNKIGALLEELMAKLITETPEQPIPFLIGYLQSKLGIVPSIQKTVSGSAALWAESESPENKRREFRFYDKPWQGNAKKPKKSKSDLAVSNISPPSPESKSLPRSIEHPKWDWRTKPDSQDFDELNHILQESKKLGKALENLSRSIAISDELEQDSRAFNSSLLRPCVIGEWVGREENDADPLAAEMLQAPIPRTKTENWEEEESGGSPAGSLKMEPKNKGLKQQQQQHKKLLAAMLSQDSFDSVHSAAASATEEDIDNEDDAMELLEDLDDLRMEGVTSLMMTSGSKFSQGRSTYSTEPQAKVTLNICSRCARLQGENVVEGVIVRQEALSPEQAVPEAGASLPGVETKMEDEEEFESASQVTGPRHPVWDSDALSVRSGASVDQKLLKEALTAKELKSMEKHLADIEKDLALMAEARVSKSPSGVHSNQIIADNQRILQTSPGPNMRSQGSSQSAKSVQFPVQGSKSPTQANNRVPATSLSNSRPQTPNSQTNKLQSTSAAGSRPATPNSTLSRALSTGSQGSKEGVNSLQRSRSVTPRSQSGRATHPLVRATVHISAENIDNISRRSSFTEEEALQQLQAAHQPWVVPSDTESEGLGGEHDKRL